MAKPRKGARSRRRPGARTSLAREIAEADASLLIGEAARSIVELRGIIPTGAESLDVATGRGGIPLGRISMLQGGEGGGKTTLALSIVCEVQRMDGVALFFDVERKLDIGHAIRIGVDMDELIMGYPADVETAVMKIAKAIDRHTEISEERGVERPLLIVVDSITALDTKLATTIEKKAEQGTAPRVGSQASAISELLRQINPRIGNRNVALLLISQLRTKITRFGAREDATCGRAPKFYSALIIQTRGEHIRKAGKRVGLDVECECVKNQIATPFKRGRFQVSATGIDRAGSLLEAAAEVGLATAAKSGWVTFEDDSPWPGMKVQGGRGLRVKARKDPDLLAKLRAEIRRRAFGEGEEK